MTDEECELCGLRGEHMHLQHVMQIHGNVHGEPVDLDLLGCLACQQVQPQGEMCPALIETKKSVSLYGSFPGERAS
jgi:hypothetical protein